MIVKLADGKQIEIVFECGNFDSHDTPDLIDSLVRQDRVFRDHEKPVLILEFCPACSKYNSDFLTKEVCKTHQIHELITNKHTTFEIDKRFEKIIDKNTLELEKSARNRNVLLYINIKKLNGIISDNNLSWNKETKEKLKTLISECETLYEEE